MRPPLGWRLWLELEAHGGKIPVYTAPPPIYLDEVEVEAYYDAEAPRLVVARRENVVLMKQRLHHEILHVCFGAHTSTTKAQVLGRDQSTREESIVSFLEPVQFDLLMRNGFLAYPDPPTFTARKSRVRAHSSP